MKRIPYRTQNEKKEEVIQIMKIKDGFVLRHVADSWMAVPIGSMAGKVQGLISLNETAAEIWNILKEDHSEEEVTEILAERYNEEKDILAGSVREFVQELDNQGIIEK